MLYIYQILNNWRNILKEGLCYFRLFFILLYKYNGRYTNGQRSITFF